KFLKTRGTALAHRGKLFSGTRRRCIFVVVALSIAASIAGAQNKADDIPDRLLTNQDIIEMLGSGMTPLAVISRIHNSPCKFDKSSAGLETLKAANVPYHIVLAMMKAPELPPATKGHIVVVIPDSTPLQVGLSEDLNSSVQQPGYVIYFEVLEEVRIRGLRVIAKGARRQHGIRRRTAAGEKRDGWEERRVHGVHAWRSQGECAGADSGHTKEPGRIA